ncbi:MAG: hypothetical protein HQM08_01440 [Candidatus Riflebacteria bacterium]|nr:hypothetical protein [Candidatus Riflebacteria bacterium]
MNSNFPPLPLIHPEFVPRRKVIPPFSRFPQESILQSKKKIARLLPEISRISRRLRTLSDEDRRNIFLKIQHDLPIDLSGTGLKPISERASNITLVIPREDSLDKLEKKISDFGQEEIFKGHIKGEKLVVPFQEITLGNPLDRLCDDFFNNYEKIIKLQWINCEIELGSFVPGKNKQRKQLEEYLSELGNEFHSGIDGNLFEHEMIKGTIRAVIRCSGRLFKKLVEGKEWQTKILWFDEIPEFQTFKTTLDDFKMSHLGELSSPPPDNPTICIIDSGVSPGNPFLKPVAREELVKSFLKHSPEDPYDKTGHGSSVASLASYYTLDITKGGKNAGKVDSQCPSIK